MTNPVAMKSLLPGNLCTEIPTLISRLTEEMTNSGLAKEMYKMNLEHWVILNSKKAITESGVHVKRLPLTKDGTNWAISWVIISSDWNTVNMFKSMSSYWYLGGKKVNDHLLRMRGMEFIILNTVNKGGKLSIFLSFLIYTVPPRNKILDKGEHLL